jgi:hypothetical protein
MRQSRLMSLVEAVANVVVGLLVAVLTQVAVFPILGLQAPRTEPAAGVGLHRGLDRPQLSPQATIRGSARMTNGVTRPTPSASAISPVARAVSAGLLTIKEIAGSYGNSRTADSNDLDDRELRSPYGSLQYQRSSYRFSHAPQKLPRGSQTRSSGAGGGFTCA